MEVWGKCLSEGFGGNNGPLSGLVWISEGHTGRRC